MAILGYWEMPEEDVPPEEYWGDDEAIREWFEAVKQRRRDPNAASEQRMEKVPMWANQDDETAARIAALRSKS